MPVQVKAVLLGGIASYKESGLPLDCYDRINLASSLVICVCAYECEGSVWVYDSSDTCSYPKCILYMYDIHCA